MEAAASNLFGKTRQARSSPSPMSVSIARARSSHGYRPGPLQHELSRLVAADLVTRSKDGNRVVYQANVNHPVFRELRGLVLKTCGLPEKLRVLLLPFGAEISLAVVFGSIAKGTSHRRSDIRFPGGRITQARSSLGRAQACRAPAWPRDQHPPLQGNGAQEAASGWGSVPPRCARGSHGPGDRER